MSSDYTSRLRAELLRAGAAAEHAPGATSAPFDACGRSPSQWPSHCSWRRSY